MESWSIWGIYNVLLVKQKDTTDTVENPQQEVQWQWQHELTPTSEFVQLPVWELSPRMIILHWSFWLLVVAVVVVVVVVLVIVLVLVVVIVLYIYIFIYNYYWWNHILFPCLTRVSTQKKSASQENESGSWPQVVFTSLLKYDIPTPQLVV